MATGLPYFKFTPTEWLTGDIVYEPYEIQGLFINICALYWQRDGELKVEEIEKRYKQANAIQSLIDRFIFVENGYISISFLYEQFKERKHKSQTNKLNGSKGGRAKVANAKRTPSERVANKNKNKNNKKNKEEEEKKRDFIDPLFLQVFTDWINYKKQRNETYKAEAGEKAFYNLLLKLSNNNPVTAKSIVETSMANNWAGIFELKEKPVNDPNKPKMVY